MLISVVVSTYNQPAWLEKVLWGLAAQGDREFEVVIADDGSDPETGTLLDRYRGGLGRPVRHEWREHCGFGKCAILNQAIRVSRGDYLVFLDGDCIPRADFLTVHRTAARPGRFVSGGAFRLPLSTSESVDREAVQTGRAFTTGWLRAHGVPPSPRRSRLGAGPRWGRLLDLLTPTRATFNGGNSSAWRQDVVTVNGFDERMGHGGLDREFGARLHNAGIRGVQARHRAIVVHLDHPRGYRHDETVRRNREIWTETERTGRTRAVAGLDRQV
ncbi:MAG: glycosyltransferase [Gemmatimonadota bacterium]|nr:glycosyltransferase [Gemmatimonadota bacterium]